MPKSSNVVPRGEAPTWRHPFDPIVYPDAKILILGSFPSLKSFENHFYYAHPRNQFWPLLSDIFQIPATTEEERLALLKKARIALWDVIGECRRTNSSDTNLRECRPNDIVGLLRENPSIERILFTGQKAQTLFKRYFPDLAIETGRLASPSPAYASMSYEQKLVQWREVLKGAS